MSTFWKNKYLVASGFLILSFFLGLWLAKVFTGEIVLRQTFNLFGLKLRYYGLFMALAVLAGILLAQVRAKLYGISEKRVDDILFWVAVGGFVGARLYHVASSFNFYIHQPLQALEVWRGGLSIFGALIGGSLVLLVLKKDQPLLKILDWLAPSVILGQIIGRFGNLFNYEAFGYPSNFAKMFVPLEFRPPGFTNFDFFQPLFLYEAAANIVIFIILLKISRKNSQAGRVFFYYLFLYNIVRFFLEFQRIDSTFVWGFRLNVLSSGVLVLLSLGLLFFRKNEKAA